VRITPAECKAARKLFGWSQEELATMLPKTPSEASRGASAAGRR
jgi:hypothetical protein